MHERPMVPYRVPFVEPVEVTRRLEEDFAIANARRTVRAFSDQPVPQAAIEAAIRIASTAPSGAHRQPWHFVAIKNADVKQRLRARVEEEERTFYEHRATPEWLEALSPLGTDFVKEHITSAPWVIVVFREDYGVAADGSRIKNYYMTESVGIAVGFLIQALHRAGLATLTHTPAPMGFLREICGRPQNEKPFVLMPVGYPHPEATVPDLLRKPLAQVASFLE
jgi:iodotyrosine deiodinase